MIEKTRYLEVDEAAAARLFAAAPEGAITMLNLVKLREVADYTAAPELSPPQPISGREAFERYIAHTLPFLEASGGHLTFVGHGAEYLIGPAGQGWDLVMLVAQRSLQAFVAFASNEAYLAGIGHRTAAVLDARMLPLVEAHWTRQSGAG